jgi:hypothetical protein
LELKSLEYQALLEQRDQIVAHLQQYSAGYTALASEREQLHRQYLQQSQLMDRLQHDETHGRVQLEMSHKQLEQYQVRERDTHTFIMHRYCCAGWPAWLSIVATKSK